MAEILVTQAVLEVLFVSNGLGLLPSLPNSITLFVSGSQVINAIGLTPFTVSAELNLVSFISPVSYQWVVDQVGNEAGFVSTATTSVITRTWTFTGGEGNGARLVSARGDDDLGQAGVISFFVYPRAQHVPGLFDGNLVYETQPKRAIFPT